MKHRKLISCLLLLMGSITAHAYDFDMNGVYYNITDADAKTVEVTYVENGEGNADFYYGSVTIPRRISKDGVTYNVTAIGANAFMYCASLTAVSISTSVTSIGDVAFFRCSGLTSITIPNSVTSIGDYTFYGCRGLTSITIPNSVTSIGEWAFQSCSGLTSITIPNSVTSIGNQAFRDCSGLTSVSVETGNAKYDSRDNCNAIIETATNTLIAGCINTNIPNNVTSIGDYAFSGYSGLTSITIPNSVTSIGECAFWLCSGLTSITIPESVTSIGERAFFRCTSLKSMVVNSSTPPAFGEAKLNDACTIFVPNNSVETYKTTEGWSDYADRIQPQTGWTFTASVPCGEGTADLTFKVTSANPWEVEVSASPEDIAGALTIPATVQNENGFEFNVKGIGDNAFNTRPNLVSVVVPESVTVIGGSAFYGCSGLTSVAILGDLSHIWGNAFQDCTNLSDVSIHGVYEISNNVFNGCSSLKSITLPEGLTTIGGNAFQNSGLESIKFPSTLKEVEDNAFRDSKLNDIDFNGCSSTFGSAAFAGCNSLEQVYIPNTVSINGIQVFNWCHGLKRVEFQEGYKCPANQTFWHCINLEEVILPTNEVFNWTGWFSECPNIKTVTFLDVVEGGDWPIWDFNQQFDLADPKSCRFIIPEGKAELFLRKGYMNISDLSGLPLVREDFEAEAERIVTMAGALSDGDKASLNAALDEARAVVNAAEDYLTIFEQIDAIKSSAKLYLTTATIPQGFDVTAANVINPNIDRYAIGWKLPLSMIRVGFQTQAYSNENSQIDRFINVSTWSTSSLENGQITQTISALPAGIYRLEADLIATNQNNAETAVTGVSLFAGSKSIAVATENQKPQHFSFKFENTVTKDVTIGVSIDAETNANWVAMDNVRLIYEGKAADIPQGIDLASDENARVYLYNVETGKYLSAGHSCGTHAMLDETGLPVRLTQNAETGLWQIYFWEGSKSDQLLFSDYSSEKREEVFVDYNQWYSCADEELTQWSITQAGDGSYLIQNKKYLDTEFYLGNIPTRQDAQLNYTGVSYTDLINSATVNDNSHWLIFTKENSDQLAAKYRLMAAIMRMEASDNVNDELLAAARTVYNNADATTAEVIDITTQLNSQMGMPAENQPVDMTALIINPRFENNTTEGWSGANVVGGRADATSNHEQEFYEKDFNMYQTITGVPNGIYRLKWKGFHRPGSREHVYNEYNAGTNNASAVVYANNTQKTMLNWATGAGDADLGGWQANGVFYPHTMEDARRYFDAGHYADFLEVEVTDNVLTIGVKNTEPMTSIHWVIFSDFELEILENEEQMNNKLTMDDIRCVPGSQTALTVNLINKEEITAFQFDIELPEGVTVAENANGKLQASITGRADDHLLSCLKTGTHTYTFAALSPTSSSFSGNEGALVRITLAADENMQKGDYLIHMKEIELTKPNGLNVLSFNASATMTLKDPDSGDVNGDGRVSITDAVYIVNYILKQPADNFHADAADVNGDGRISITDAVQIVNLILNQGNHVKEVQILDPQ